MSVVRDIVVVAAVRNDRNKKRKMKEEGCSSSSQQVEELTTEDQDIIENISLAHENTFPLVMDEEKFTLPLGLALLQGRYTRTENVQMAGAALAVIPVLVLFAVLQKRIVKSLASSGLKG